jgi:DNA-binding response OmpR family regulator
MKPLAGKKILIVDDEDLLREILCEEFSALGAEACEASSGTEAFKVVTTSSPAVDALITDFRMPGGDGLSLIQNLRRTAGPLPKFFMYSGQSEINPDLLKDLNIIECFTKPFDLQQVKDKVCAALGC